MLQVRKFSKDSDGNISVMGSLVLLPVLMLVGVSIDFARLNAAHGELKSSVDNTAYALAKSDVPFKEKREMVAALIKANHEGSNVAVEVNHENGAIKVAAREVVKTPLLSMIGKGDSVIEASITLGDKTSTSSSVGRKEVPNTLSRSQKQELSRYKRRLEARLDRILKNSNLTFDQRMKMERRIHAQLNSLNSLR